jgi:hypothetical protein
MRLEDVQIIFGVSFGNHSDGKKIGLKLERWERSDFYWKCLVAPLIS